MTLRVSALDLERERDAVAQLEAAWGWTFVKYPDAETADYYAHDGRKVKALVEIKCKEQRADAYPHALLDLHKWLGLVVAETGGGIPGLVVFGFEYGVDLRWIRVREIDAHDLTITGRTDRGIASDVRPAIRVPVSNLRIVGGDRGDRGD